MLFLEQIQCNLCSIMLPTIDDFKVHLKQVHDIGMESSRFYFVGFKFLGRLSPFTK